MTARAASHVLMIEPVEFRPNQETKASNVFQQDIAPADLGALAAEARRQHRVFRDLLIENGVAVTVTRSHPDTPDAPFCNNWFSTHPGGAPGGPAEDTMVLYPLLATTRRTERRGDLIAMLRDRYPNLIDYSGHEREGRFLESTGSLCLDDQARVAYAALSARTDRGLAETWARSLGYRLVAFRATDAGGTPYYHTNVMMFIGHGLAGVCLESIGEGRDAVAAALADAGLEILPISRTQILAYCGNCLPLRNDLGEPLFAMSTAAYDAFRGAERATIERHGRIVHADLSAIEQIGGGSARCLLGELF
ncbi:MAG: amidinotransferase [Gemmatimonadetes bacterium]|nr:amidinotransferase [Gemmatimonadota bacterium]